MAWTTLSTVDQLKKNLPMLKDTNIGDAELEDNIEEADEIIRDDLSKFVDWDEVEALDSVPRTINRLAKYQAALITIVRNFYDNEKMLGSGEIEENTVYTYYKERYDKLLEQFEAGSIKLLDDENEELGANVARTPGLGRII